jgi:hypothetical protein
MRDSLLTTAELLVYARARVQYLERLGLDRQAAIKAVAIEDQLDETTLAALLGRSDVDHDGAVVVKAR